MKNGYKNNIGGNHEKVLILISILVLALVLTGCGNKIEKVNDNNNVEISEQENISEQVNEEIHENNEEQVVTNTSEEELRQEFAEQSRSDNKVEEGEKVLIAFFSRADENYSVGTVDVGNTEIMAGFIKDYLGDKAETFKIDPVVAYPKDYKECTEYATKEKNENARPEFKNADDLNISKYDTIILGYPIWWGDVPMIINTFLEKYDFSGKTIYLFNTHEGSGNSGTYGSIKNKMTSANVDTNGLAIRGAEARKESSRSTVENWLKGLSL